MIVGIPAEAKENENRVGLTPQSAKKLTSQGHSVLIEKGAGAGTGFSDQDYVSAGCMLQDDPLKIASACDILVKVKEPIAEEYPLLEQLAGKTLYTFLHLAAAPKELTRQLLTHKITGIAYETIERDGRLPCLAPMSEVAGVLSIQYGAQYLQRKYGGRGVTLGSITGADPAHVVVIGGGTAGGTAARTAISMGCCVTVFERDVSSADRVRARIITDLTSPMKEHLMVTAGTPQTLLAALEGCDLLVGAALVRGAKAPRVVTEEMVKAMPSGAVIVDIAIDQGGCVWGSRPTSHTDPIYETEGKIYCCITNMPGQVSRQSTQALNAATVPYLEKMCSAGVVEALQRDAEFAKGVNTYRGKLVYEAVGKALGLPTTALSLSSSR